MTLGAARTHHDRARWRALGRRVVRTHQQHAHAERQIEVLVLDAGADQRLQRLERPLVASRAQEQHALVIRQHLRQAAILLNPERLRCLDVRHRAGVASSWYSQSASIRCAVPFFGSSDTRRRNARAASACASCSYRMVPSAHQPSFHVGRSARALRYRRHGFVQPAGFARRVGAGRERREVGRACWTGTVPATLRERPAPQGVRRQEPRARSARSAPKRGTKSILDRWCRPSRRAAPQLCGTAEPTVGARGPSNPTP